MDFGKRKGERDQNINEEEKHGTGLIGNGLSDLLLHGVMLNPLNHPGQTGKAFGSQILPSEVNGNQSTLAQQRMRVFPFPPSPRLVFLKLASSTSASLVGERYLWMPLTETLGVAFKEKRMAPWEYSRRLGVERTALSTCKGLAWLKDKDEAL